VLEQLTFLLAPLGYAGLTASMISAVYRHTPLGLWRVTALVIVTHVGLVWHVRYAWQFNEATRNGYAGFAMFHTALLAIVVSTIVGEDLRRKLLVTAFLVVSLGASVAVYKYDVVAGYRFPVHAITAIGLLAVGRRLWLASRGPTPA